MKIHHILRKEHGFSLLEVVASLVILSIILISFFQLIIQSNVAAKHNTNKLVLINLADAELERMQAMTFTSVQQLDDYILNHTTQIIAGEQYDVTIEKQLAENNITIQNSVASMPNEEELKLYNIVVKVSDTINEKTSSSISEGYVYIYD